MYQITAYSGSSAHETRVGTVASFSPELITKTLWAPGIFRGSRSNTNLMSIGLIVLDIDDGFTLSQALKEFAPYRHVIGTSKSHQIEKNGKVADRFRVVLFLEEPATSDEEFKQFWFAAFAKWPWIDRACKDSARFFYPCKEIVSINETGALWSERVTIETKPQVTKALQSNAKRGKLGKPTIDFLLNGAAPGEWHGKFFKAAMDFKEQGYDIEDARLKLTAVTGHLDETDEQQLEDVYENRAPKYEARHLGLITDWPLMLQSKNGDYPDRKHPDNLKHMILKLGFNLRFNQMDEAIYNGTELLSDFDLNFLWTESKRQGLEVAKDFIAAEISNIARAASYHPVKNVIESKPWDNQDHIRSLYETLRVRNDDNYYPHLRKWLIAVVAKLYKPGSQNLVLTFVGAQGIGKSRWFTKLALYDKAYGEGSCDPGNKDHELRHLTHLIWHIPELDYTTGKRETGALKDYLTRDFVSARPAYARYSREGRSICSFTASANAEEFLVDQSGNRRFIIIPLDGINPDHNVNMQQVFAQAKALFDAKEPYWFDLDEIAALNERNAQFEVRDALVTFADTLEDGPDDLTLIEVCALAGRTEPTFSELTRMGMALARRGFRKKRVRVGGKQVWVYSLKNPKNGAGLRAPKPL